MLTWLVLLIGTLPNSSAYVHYCGLSTADAACISSLDGYAEALNWKAGFFHSLCVIQRVPRCFKNPSSHTIFTQDMHLIQTKYFIAYINEVVFPPQLYSFKSNIFFKCLDVAVHFSCSQFCRVNKLRYTQAREWKHTPNVSGLV